MLTFGSLFSGIGGLDLGLERAGIKCLWQCEIDPYCRKVLAKHWPDVPCHDDIKTLDPTTMPAVDLLCGGFPCQDISNAGKRAGINGERSGLWSEFARIIRVVRPQYVVVENVAAITDRGIDRVIGDLAACGYDCEWDCLPAASAGAPHIRDRTFVVANAEGHSILQLFETSLVADPTGIGQPGPWECQSQFDTPANPYREASGVVNALLEGTLPYVCRRHDGIPASMDRMRGLGNAVVPQVAEFIGRAIVAAHRGATA